MKKKEIKSQHGALVNRQLLYLRSTMWLISLLIVRQYDTLILLDDILEMGNKSPFAREPNVYAR